MNSVLAETAPIFKGYSILLFRARSGVSEPAAYTNALKLLNQSADVNHVGEEEITQAKMLNNEPNF